MLSIKFTLLKCPVWFCFPDWTLTDLMKGNEPHIWDSGIGFLMSLALNSTELCANGI